MKIISVLCVRADSNYKNFNNLDLWDIERDAAKYADQNAVIAHPPCRSWGRLRHFAKPRLGERDLARHCVAVIRKNGGVLEHPEASTLFADQQMPKPGEYDKYGGFTWPINQSDFGHPSRKATWLYIVGIKPNELPAMPFSMSYPISRIGKSKEPGKPGELNKRYREYTPIELAGWLIQIARLCAK